jgi:hypothetical protein
MRIVTGAVVISLFLVIGSLYIPYKIRGPSDSRTIPLGYPFKFIWQDNIYDPPYTSYWYHFDAPLSSPTRFSGRMFFLNVLLVSTSLSLTVSFARYSARRRQPISNRKSPG